MKKALIVGLALAAVATTFAYEVGYYSGGGHAGYCYHIQSQMQWTMRFNQYGTPDVTGTTEFTQMETAMNTWSNVTNQWYRNNRGSNTSVMNLSTSTPDGQNIMVYYEPSYSSYGQTSWPYSSSTIAVNLYWMQWNSTFWLVTENDIGYNGINFTWSGSGQSGMMDVQNISAHELGHNLVLADLYQSYAQDYTMYGYSSLGETKKRDLHADDIAGIRFIYGYSGVTLESFTATARDGAVAVRWAAASENNHAGYNLYRADDDGDAAYVKLNGALIRGQSPYSFTDEEVTAGSYKYLLEAVDLNGHKESFGPARVRVTAGVKTAFALGQSYPNPARGAVTIDFALPESGRARLEVFDLSGRRVATLADGDAVVGERSLTWDLRSEDGSAVAPGVYIYRLDAGGKVATRRMVVAR